MEKDYICIDLGAKYTGVFLANTSNNEVNKTEGFTIINDPNNITWSQESRRSTRHRVRSLKRRKLAKRLFWEIYKTKKEKINKTEREFINGLFNRRGYTYKNVEEISIEDNPIFENRDFINNLKIFENLTFQDNETLIDFFERAANHFKDDKETLKKSLERISFLKNFKLSPVFEEEYNEIKDLLKKGFFESKDDKKKIFNEFKYSDFLNLNFLKENKNYFDRINKKLKEKQLKRFDSTNEVNYQEFTKVLKQFKEFIDNQLKEIEEGHKHRRVYIQDIEKEIQNSNFQFPFKKEEMKNLIGNISNFQLRLLRKYFNNKFNNNYDDIKLKKLFYNWIKSWRTKENQEVKTNKNIILNNKEDKVLDFLLNTDPNKTIPPFEDQDNRHPQKDNTLYINEKFLDNNYKFWRELLKCFIEKDKDLLEDVDKIVESSIFMKKQIIDRDALILQRLFDRNMLIDNFKFRLLSKFFENKKLEKCEAYKDLKQNISANDDLLHKFIEIANRYYNEVINAKLGLWSKSNDSILKRIDLNCPKVKNCSEIILSSIFGKKINKEDVKRLYDFMKTEKIKPDLKGARTKQILSWAKDCKQAQKDYGTYLNKKILDVKAKHTIGKLNKKNDGYELLKISEAVKESEELILKKFFKTNKTRDFGSIYSFAQIYSFLESDTTGFFNSSKPTALENAWRDKTIDFKDIKTNETKQISNAVRLPKDSVRPFDGQLGSIMERLSFEIFKKYKNFNNNNSELSILIEQNNFEFERDLKRDIKKSIKKTRLEQIKNRVNEYEEKFQKKRNEIKNDSKGICPYTGVKLGNNGEIDHIISRSDSRKGKKTVFNSRFNLIYSSTQGNRIKGNKKYTLKNIHPNFLSNIFNTSDLKNIENLIIDNIKNIKKKYGKTIITSELNIKERTSLRLALFSENDVIKEIIYELLDTKSKTLVNGTQAYLCKNLINKIRSSKKIKKINVKKVPVEEIKFIRENIPEEFADLKKEDHQKPYSHIIDAASIFCNEFKEEQSNIRLEEIAPEDFTFIEISSNNLRDKDKKGGKSLLNSSIYSERYLPIFVKDNLVYIGFSIKNSVLYNKDTKKCFKFLENISEFLRFKGKKIDDLNKILNNKKNNTFYFTIDKIAVQNHYHNKARKNEKINNEIEKCLSDLRYFTKRKKIEDIFEININKEGKVKFKIKKDDDFKVKKINLPIKSKIMAVYNEINQKIENGHVYKKDEEILNDIVRIFKNCFKLFLRESKNNFHKKVHKFYSIPVSDSPSGGLRIKRSTPYKESEFQIQATNNTIGQTAGFDNDFKVVNHPHFIKTSKKTSYIDGENSPKIMFNYGQEFNLDLSDKYKDLYKNIICTLVSSSRQKIDISIPIDVFKEKYLPNIEDLEKDIKLFNLPGKLKFKKDKFPITDIKPRDNKVSFYGIKDKNVILKFTTSGTNKYLKEKILNA